MNYLGHLYFSNNDIELMYANIYGDFVKGSDLSNYSDIAQKGILLHRKIDDFIDRNSYILELNRILSPLLPKVYGIAIDLFFDHWLAKNWYDYHDKPLHQFITEFYRENALATQFENVHFHFLIKRMREDDWLNQYATVDGLNFAATGLSNRISFPNDLWKAKDVYLAEQTRIDETLEIFMKEAQNYFQ